MGNYTIFLKFENPRRGRQARNLSENDPKILDLKSSSEQIIFRKLSLGAPDYQCGTGECCTSRGQCYYWRSSQRSPAIVGIVVSFLVVITIIVSIMQCSCCACCPAYYRCRQSSSWNCDNFLWYPCHSAPALRVFSQHSKWVITPVNP